MREAIMGEEVKILEDVLNSLPPDADVRYEPADVRIPPTLTSGSPKKVYEIAKKYGFLDEKVTVNIDGRSVYIEGLWEVDLETMFNDIKGAFIG